MTTSVQRAQLQLLIRKKRNLLINCHLFVVPPPATCIRRVDSKRLIELTQVHRSMDYCSCF